MTEFERKAFGMTTEEVRQFYIEPIRYPDEISMTIAGILSDCQEMIQSDPYPDTLRKVIKNLNIAKYVLFETEKA